MTLSRKWRKFVRLDYHSICVDFAQSYGAVMDNAKVLPICRIENSIRSDHMMAVVGRSEPDQSKINKTSLAVAWFKSRQRKI